MDFSRRLRTVTLVVGSFIQKKKTNPKCFAHLGCLNIYFSKICTNLLGYYSYL